MTRIFSYGGGVQSNAVLLLQALGKLPNPFDVFVFANTGDDSENPSTLAYVRNIAMPFALQHGITLIEVQKTRYGEPETLLEAVERDNRSIPIPMYLKSGAPGNRTCTTDFKIGVINKWARLQGYQIVEKGLGISVDEFTRTNCDLQKWHDSYRGKKYGFRCRVEYPLIELRMTRMACVRLLETSGLLPLPPKSSCWFCPFRSANEWRRMRIEQPELFQRALELERTANRKRGKLGKDEMFLHRRKMPLEKAVELQDTLFDLDSDSCESGYCFV